MRTGTDEARAPKYAHIERERRWLVDPRLRPPLADRTCVLIEDRYVSGTRLRLRRMTELSTGQQSLKLTKKYDCADPLARPIVTTYLNNDEYALLANLPATTLIKRRHKVDGFSLDQFDGPLSGLELAEAECPDDASLAAVQPPTWAIREVSRDSRYDGGALAASGWVIELTP
jgi:CYTH domain-containing protein